MQTTADSTERATKIFKDLADIAFGDAAVAVVAAALFIAGIKWFVPKLAGWLPDRFRFYVLPWEPVLRLLVLVLLILFVTPIFIKPTPENLLAVGGGLAVALGFAFKDYISSLIAGVVALYERPYRSGDWVRIDEVYGEVQSLDLRAVRVRTPDDDIVSIPHGRMWTEPVHNANTGRRELMCVADFYLDPEHDGELVRGALRDVALSSPYLQLDRPVVVVAAEKPWGTHYRLKAYPIDGRDQFQFLTDLTLRGKSLLSGHGLRPAAMPASLLAGFEG